MRSTRHLAALAIAWGALIAASGHAMPAPGDENPTDPAVIDNTGAARHRIPIEVPPGPGGFAPRLALSYSSRSGDGPFGVGWSLGIPEIRCSDRFGVPNYASCLKYELGSDILVPDPDLEKPNEYHTFVESFQRIRFDPLNNLWTVEQPSGTKLVFGGPATHRILQGSSTARWLLERMEDAFGNKVFFIYNSPTAFSNYDPALDSSSAYLTNVFYGANASSSSGPREVRFHYGARPDQRQVYASGIARNMRHRLREIQVFGHSLLFKRYAFGYDGLSGVAYTTDRSRLSWVQEDSVRGLCLRPIPSWIVPKSQVPNAADHRGHQRRWIARSTRTSTGPS